jgi:atypical dual specificity phosphatase
MRGDASRPPGGTIGRILERARGDPAFRERLMAAPLEAVAAYPLSAAERRWFVLPNFGWLVPGELAGSARPAAPASLAALRAAGVRVVLNLGERRLPEAEVAAAGLREESLPVPDMTAPTGAQLAAAVGAIDAAVAAGEPVVVCCGAGLGRTGTVLAAALVRRGRSAGEAIAEVRARRPGSVETPEQEAAVAAYERTLRAGGYAPPPGADAR